MAEGIPDIVIGRLPIYLRALNYMAAEDKVTTSSQELGQRLGISSAQIRKDLSHFGEFGKQGTGYNIGYLIEQLRQILHLDREWPVALVGAGYLGHALANYQGFKHRGFHINWIFDNDPEIVGQEMAGYVVHDVSDLEEIVAREGVLVAILAVPAAAAQEIADVLVASGIKSILSYAPINLGAPAGVQVRYSDPVVQLQQMTFYLES
ncbi:MAG TPA: redox-sensing transcriptional repressor Rex [Anaerolineae bacterium]|nr:redox-sensing transcriptional repressor Rex [Anaerolineae bacterium]